MSDVDPEDIIKSVGDANLELLAEKAGIKVPQKKKGKGVDNQKLIEDLVKYVENEGTKLVLGVIKVPRLKMMVDIPDVDLPSKWQPPEPRKGTPKKGEKKTDQKKPTKPYPSKTVMTDIMEKYLIEKGWKDFVNGLNDKILLAICRDVDDLRGMDEEELKGFTEKEMKRAILTNVYTFGLNHLLTFLTVKELRKICDVMDLNVDSSSQEILIDSIIERKNFKKAKKKAPSISKSKPSEIKKGITKADLNNWFNRDEIEEWLKEKKEKDDALKDLKISGKKSQLIDRVLKILEGDIEGATKKKKRGRGSRSRSPSKSKEDAEAKKRKTTKS